MNYIILLQKIQYFAQCLRREFNAAPIKSQKNVILFGRSNMIKPISYLILIGFTELQEPQIFLPLTVLQALTFTQQVLPLGRFVTSAETAVPLLTFLVLLLVKFLFIEYKTSYPLTALSFFHVALKIRLFWETIDLRETVFGKILTSGLNSLFP